MDLGGHAGILYCAVVLVIGGLRRITNPSNGVITSSQLYREVLMADQN